jgi:hypothetical protein
LIALARLLGLLLFFAGLVAIAWSLAGIDPADPAFQALLGNDTLRQAVTLVLQHGWTLLLAGIALGVGLLLLLLAQIVRETG